MNKIESSVRTIPYSQEQVYNKLSDLKNLEAMKEKLPEDKVQDFSCDTDTMSISMAPVGTLTLRVIDREPPKCIKLETVDSPIPFNLWIQVVPSTESECKMKLTVGIEVNPLMRGMVQKPLHDALEKMVDTLSALEY